jgi:hypothetical protein
VDNLHSAIETPVVRHEARQLEQTHALQCLLSLEETMHLRPSFLHCGQGSISLLFCNIQLACASRLVVEVEGIEAGDASLDNGDCPALIVLLLARNNLRAKGLEEEDGVTDIDPIQASTEEDELD